MLNDVWALIPVKPKYQDFNVQIPFGTNVPALEAFEKKNPELGITDFGHAAGFGERDTRPIEGMTTLSLIATITDVLAGKRLAAKVEDDGTISGWCWFGSPL